MYRGDLGPIEQLTPHIFDAVNYPHGMRLSLSLICYSSPP